MKEKLEVMIMTYKEYVNCPISYLNYLNKHNWNLTDTDNEKDYALFIRKIVGDDLVCQ